VSDPHNRPRSLEEELEELRIPEGHPPFEGRPGKKRRILLWAVVLALLIGIGVAVWQFWPAAKPVAVADIVVREGGATAAAMTAAGYVAAEEMATVSARVIGRLVYMPLDVGNRVRAGQVIARLDDAEYGARLRRAEADLAAARAAQARLEAGSRPEEIRQAEARLASVQAALEEAERNYRRTEELFRRELIAAADRDRAWAAYETARARAQEAREGLGLARIGPREEDIAEARARVRTAEGEVELARAQLGYTVITAPIDGIVIDRKAQVGDTLFPGEPELSLPGRLTQLTARRGSVIVRLADMRQVNVEVDLNESDIGKVSVGSPATVVPDTAPDKKYEGRVVRVYPMADRQKKTIQVQVRIQKPDASLRPEGGARVTFHTGPPKSGGSALLVPKAAVQKPSGSPEVFVVRDGRVQRRAVTLGAEERDYVEVRSGVARGEQVVVQGADGLRDGDRVRVTDAARERGGSR
jgi:RND family efflux transporter MFP subunit